MPNNIFEQYPHWLDSTAWYELIRAKNKNDEDKIIRLSSPIIIENKFLDPTTGVEKLTITDGKNIERIETSDILTTQKLPRLVIFGFSINEKYIKSLGNALQLMRQSLPISTLYTGVGVLSTDEGTVISLDEPYLSKDIEQSQADEIICETKYDLQPKGTFEGWWQMYLDEVKGNLLLELAVIFGVSSLVTAFLKTKHEVEYFGTIFSFMGNSSTGKSTAAALAVSIAGNPSKGDQTLFRGWNGTRNAIEGYLSNNFGVPIALDELSAATFKDTTKILSRVLATDIDIAKIRDYFINYHAHTVSERSLADKAIEVITQSVAQNRGKFSDDKALKNMIENHGLIALKDEYIEVKIIASVFKNMLLEHHFQDVNNVVNALRDKGFIESDHDRITTKRTVKDDYGKKQSLVFYHLKLDSEYASIFGLTKDAEPIKSEINLDNKKILESWKKQNDDLIDF
ncbi:DUF927 domain-containing protein [Staphylococcus haemolyticus]|uniref:DUF927 domain-containing protein n=1 Tax=Staphylococcus haemolyticus TaxID=1283 RepID=UPI0030D01720